MSFDEIFGLVYVILLIFLIVCFCIWLIYCELLQEKKRKEYLSQLDYKEKLLIQDYEDYKKVNLDDFRKKKDNESK